MTYEPSPERAGHPEYRDAYALLAEVYVRQSRSTEAQELMQPIRVPAPCGSPRRPRRTQDRA